ncbi:Condensin complex subunit 1 [Eumeta japonica]|uniref:Condensin complex subunit 1 n=1 Tax=Eumeta variegata TaxID=151549 RepID=A0A4C1XCY8_EUMVA|nr:Condensin complex subunit 1 [Eumeta japonica]
MTEEEGGLEGAVADDADAEYIRSVCERDIVGTDAVLARYLPLLRHLLTNPGRCTPKLQAAAALTLTRFMLVSSTVCEDSLQLMVTVLKRSKNVSLRTNLTIAFADLTLRFPNLTQPWTQHIYHIGVTIGRQGWQNATGPRPKRAPAQEAASSEIFFYTLYLSCKNASGQCSKSEELDLTKSIPELPDAAPDISVYPDPEQPQQGTNKNQSEPYFSVNNIASSPYVTDKDLKMKANSVAEKLSINPEFSKTRQRKVKRYFDELCEDERLRDPESLFKVNIFYRVLDIISNQLKSRFLPMNEIVSNFSVLQPSTLQILDDTDLLKKALEFVDVYKKDISESFAREILIFGPLSETK